MRMIGLRPTAAAERLNAASLRSDGHEFAPPAAVRRPARAESLPAVCSVGHFREARSSSSALELDAITRQTIAAEVLKEIRGRLGFLKNVGLDYLTLDRTAPTLSGGEMQRIRLAGQIGCGLVGVLYILDEPSIGLHPRDNDRLLDTLASLRDQGNTVIVVEHDEDTMRAADHLIDFGPGPGVRGGEGRRPRVGRAALRRIEEPYRPVSLHGAGRSPCPKQRRPIRNDKLVVRGAARTTTCETSTSKSRLARSSA
jgi:excinuclease ABC subunit A